MEDLDLPVFCLYYGDPSVTQLLKYIGTDLDSVAFGGCVVWRRPDVSPSLPGLIPTNIKNTEYMKNKSMILLAIVYVIAVVPVVMADDVDSVVSNEDAIWEEAIFDEELETTPCFPDPLEGINRRTLSFNEGLDRWVLGPLVDVYGFLVPNPVRTSVYRMFTNLDAPSVFANDLLQANFEGAGITFVRFALNSTVGLAGLMDPAAHLGISGHDSDFGQTLALVGVGSGPYIVLPVLGPTTLRDGFGQIVDMLFRPTTYLLAGTDQIMYTTIQGGSAGLAIRDFHDQGLEALRSSSIDFYAALRNAYYQERSAVIQRLSEGL